MPEKDKKLIQRFGHGAAAVTVNSDCVEVIMFGGERKYERLLTVDPVVLRFGKYGRVVTLVVVVLYIQLCLFNGCNCVIFL